MKELPTLRVNLDFSLFGSLELTGISWYSKEELKKMAQSRHVEYSLYEYATMLGSRIRQANLHHAQLKLTISQLTTYKKLALGEGTSRLVRKFEERKVSKAIRKKVSLALLMFEVDGTEPSGLEETVEAIDDTIKELEGYDKKLHERRGLLGKQLERVQNILRDQGIKVDLKLWQLEGPRKDSGVNLHE